MDNSNDSYLEELNQLREKQNAVVAEVEEIRQRNGGIVPAEIEGIQNRAREIVEEIDSLRRDREDEITTRPHLARPNFGATGAGVFFCPEPTQPHSRRPRA